MPCHKTDADPEAIPAWAKEGRKRRAGRREGQHHHARVLAVAHGDGLSGGANFSTQFPPLSPL